MNYLRKANVARAKEDFKTYENAGVLYFTTALAGEVGELCNLIKKLERAKVGGPDIGHTSKLKDITPEKLRDEFGGILIYLDLLASMYGVDLDLAVIETFNRVSREIGSKHTLPHVLLSLVDPATLPHKFERYPLGLSCKHCDGDKEDAIHSNA